jgi:protoporphyrinogen/coproporphyrinogen III oxidase
LLLQRGFENGNIKQRKRSMKLVVIGGGVSGLATAYRIRERFAVANQPLELHLFESEERAGGKIFSESAQGYLMEWGPNGFLDSKPDTLKLCGDLGLEDELLRSRDAARKRFIFSGGRLHRVPESPVAFFRSPLLSVGGRFRILKEAWAPGSPPGQDTTIAEFGSRRLGREAMEKLLDPMVSGIFAGDPAVMSLASCFPRIAEMEKEYGSLLRAMMALARERKRKDKEAKALRGLGRKPEATVGGGPAGPGGTLTSFRGGMSRLVEALARELGDAVLTRARVVKISHEPGGVGTSCFRISCRHQDLESDFRADAVVVALPAHEASCILEPMAPEVSRLLSQIPYAPVAVVGLGFPEDAAPGALDGFGFLVPHGEGVPLLGSLWTSSIFPGRAPDGSLFTRNMVGGWRNGSILSKEDAELQEMVLQVLEKALHARGQVEFRRVVRHAKAIPLYTVGHGIRLQEIEERVKAFPGLYLTGNAYRGVALNDCTREAERVAGRVESDWLKSVLPRGGK